MERVTERISSEISRRLEGSATLSCEFFRVDVWGRAWRVGPSWLQNRGQSSEEQNVSSQIAEGDVVFLLDHSLPPSGFNAREVRYLQAKKVTVLVMVHDVLPIVHRSMFPPKKYYVFLDWLRGVAQARKIIFNSETTRQQYKLITKQLGLPQPLDELVIPLGSWGGAVANRCMKSDADKSDKFRLLAVGTLEPRKDYEGVLDALDLLWGKELDVGLTIVGRRGWMCRSLVRRLQTYSAHGRPVEWRSDVDDAELQGLMRSHDMLVANSIAEGFGLPLAEAASAGLPVLARDIAVFRELHPFADFYIGGSPTDLASAIQAAFRKKQMNSLELVFQPHPRTWFDSGAAVMSFIRRFI